jgi:hypothetical protein
MACSRRLFTVCFGNFWQFDAKGKRDGGFEYAVRVWMRCLGRCESIEQIVR